MKTSPRKKRVRWKWWIAGIVVLLLLGVGTFAFTRTRASTPTEIPRTVAVSRGNLTMSVSGSGTVAAEYTLAVPFQTSGRVETVLVREGDTVDAGQVLARLYRRELELAVADAEASLASAEAQLEQAQKGNATPQDVSSAEVNVMQAQAQLNQQVINMQASIASAESRVRAAQANLDQLLKGPRPEAISSAQRSYDQALVQYQTALTSLQETRDNLSEQKTRAHQAMEQAALDLQTAQSNYSVAYWRYQGVKEKDRVPSSTESSQQAQKLTNESLTDYGQLEESEAFRQAEIRLQNAEKNLEQARLAYEQAGRSEITGVQKAEQNVASAESSLRDAEVQLKATQEGATETEIAQARESLLQAQIELRRLNDVRNSEITQSKASVDQAVVKFEDLTAPSTDTDLRIRQASLMRAQNDLERARIALENAELTAPFGGTVIALNVIPGSVVGSGSAVLTLMDRDPLHVDLTLNENDITKIAIGQDVHLTISAMSGWQTTGKVSYIAPVSESSSDVVTYLVRVSFPDTDQRVKVGMTADLDIITTSVQDVLTVPNTAILPMGERKTVLVFDPTTQTSRPQPIEVGISDGTATEIIAGLQEGDLVVANPTLREGNTQGPGMFRMGPPPGGSGGRPPDSGGRPGGGNTR